MTKVYVLKYYYNNYEQLDGYVEAVFAKHPDFHALKSYYSGESIHGTPRSQDKTLDACLGMLSRGESVNECGDSGGDMWVVEGMKLL